MKTTFLLLFITVFLLSACTTAYKSAQTPDDVYFSPNHSLNEHKKVKQDDQGNNADNQYYDDRYLRMKVHNHILWSELDDWYSYDRYSLAYNYTLNPFLTFNPYISWNYNYNPYCSQYHTNTMVIKNLVQHTPRYFNLQTYSPQQYESNNGKINPFTNTANTYYNNSYSPSRNSSMNNGSNTGGFLRQIFNGNGNSGTRTTNSGVGASSSSSGGSHTSTSAPVRKF
jgi:hypothetical protein